MSVSARRDTLKVDTVMLQQDTGQYIAVDRDGGISSANSDAFGITMQSGSAGDPVSVCRLGFCPVIVATAANNNAEKTELAVADNGHLDAVPTSGGGTSYVVGLSEEATSADGSQTGAWVDCLSAGRDRTIPA